MDRFIILQDFETLIQEDKLNQVIESDNTILDKAILEAVEEAACHVRHRYDEDQVFAIVNTFALSVNYAVDDRIVWSPDAYDDTAAYVTGDIVSYSDNIYRANKGTTGTFAPADWDIVTANNTLYYVIQATTGTQEPDNTAYFTEGDARNSKLVQVTVDIILYNIHSRLSPRNIPELRSIRYDGAGNKKEGESAITWLEKVSNGKITPNLQVIVDDEGETPQNTERVSYGTSPNTKYRY